MKAASTSFQPLAGIRVIDLSQVLAGPYASYQLALMGAEIIKIEMPGVGDWTRNKGDQTALNKAGMGVAYLTQNANKKSVSIDLKHPEGLQIVKQLIADADVFLENFRPGAAARLGLSYDDVHQIKPNIVYCSISAYGQDGPMSERPAYDHVVQGMSGIMKTTGTKDTGPLKVGAPYVDYATGLNAAFAIVSGLHEVHRTGHSVSLDVAMLDTSMNLMASVMTTHLNSGWVPEPSGNEAWSKSPASGAFQTQDGLLMLAANNARQFVDLCRALGRDDILSNERWNSSARIVQHAASLRTELNNHFMKETAQHWEDLLSGAGVPAARVRGIDEILSEKQAEIREFTSRIEVPGHPTLIHIPTLGFKANGAAIAASTPPPALGQNTQEILRQLGLSDATIDTLVQQGVVDWGPLETGDARQ